LRDAEAGGRTGGVLHALRGALVDAVRVAVAPDVGRQDRLVAPVDRVAGRLADEMRAERPALQPVPLEQLALRRHVVRLGKRAVDLEVVAPARKLEPVEAPPAGLRGQLLERQVRPLAGEERDGPGHSGR
jgi:hypothetical protein